MGSHDDIATRWIDRELGRTTKQNYSGRNSNVWGEDGALYSYGRHFELARPLKKKNAGQAHANDVVGWLLNGDRYSVTTNRHQAIVRNAIARTGMPSVIIPHEALRSAGVDLSTIEIVDVTADGHETIPHRSNVQPEGARWRREEVWGRATLSDDELTALVAEKNANRERWGLTGTPVATVDSLQQYEREPYRVIGHEDRLYVGRGRTRVTVTTNDDGSKLYEWETYRHWLGASLIRAAVPTFIGRDDDGRRVTRRRWAHYLSAFDEQETRRLYFLAELPRGVKPATVAEAFEDLKPDVVKVAETMGREVTRQGDIFAVAMPGMTLRGLRKDGAVIEKGPRISEVWRYRDRYTALGDIPAADDETTMHDEDGPGRIRGDVETIDRGREWRALLGQNHYATEVARMPDGTTFARGTLKHDPEWRAADHARRKMGDGKTWHLIVKNTVPTAR